MRLTNLTIQNMTDIRNTGNRLGIVRSLAAMGKILAIGTVVVATNAMGVTIGWNFSDDNATYDTGTPVNFTIGSFSIGNTLGTVSDPVNSTSASSGYTGSTGTGNIGNAVRTGGLSKTSGGSAYYEISFTPTAGYQLQITDFDFGTRSTTTGPQSYSLFSSIDAYGVALMSGSITNNSSWAYKDNTAFALTAEANTPVTLRLYVYGGSGSPGSGTINHRLDDIKITVTANPVASGNNTAITASTTNVALGRVMQTASNPTNNVTLNKTGSDTTTYTVVAGGSASVTGAGTSFAGGSQSDQIGVGIDRATTGAKTGTVTVDNTAANSAGANQGSADPNDVINVSGTVVADRQIDGSVNVGKVFVGTSVSGTATLTTTGDSDHFTTVTVNGDAVVQGNASVAAGVTTTFDDTSDTVSREITGTFGQSGNGQSLSVDLNVTGEGLAGENAGATASLQADVYQHALLVANDSATLGNNGVATVFNEFSDDGGQRAAAVISGSTVTGSGWSATDFEGGVDSGAIAESEEVTSTVSFDSANKLNGSHVGTLVVGFADEAGIAGGGSLGSRSWALSANVSGNTALTGVAQTATVLAGNGFAGFGTTHASGLATQMTMRAGTAASAVDVVVTFSDIGAGALSGVANDATRVSDIVSLEGTGSNVIVLQLSYNDAGITDESTVALFWLAGGAEEWTLATTGNTGAGALAGAYAMSYDAFLAANGGVFDGATMLGAYGVDTTGNTTWAVINHNSDFAVNVVPEPGTVALFAIGGAFLCGIRRRYQARA